MNDRSFLVSKTLNFIFPFVIIYSIYIIANGHISPGGGFQGGAIIASLFIIKYLVNPTYQLKLKKIRFAEKVILFLIFLFPLGFLITFIHLNYSFLNVYYLILMNLLIGLKVACGLTIIFIRFIFYEDR